MLKLNRKVMPSMSSLKKKKMMKTTTTKKKKKKKKMKTKTTKKKKLSQPNPNPSLPDDLLLTIVARVSRLCYPTLSLVSKSFQSLVSSPELYKARTLIGRTESCLYVCFELYPGPNSKTHWFTLCQKQDQTLTNNTCKKKSSEYVLSPIPSSPPVRFSSLVAVGSNIYNIGGSINEAPSSSVWILDCRSHVWRKAPSLRVELMSLSASVLDRKIYVAGLGSYKDGNDNSDSLKNSFEVFDTNTQVWDPEPIPCSKTICKLHSTRSVCIDGNFHVMTYGDVFAYHFKESRWDQVGPGMGEFWFLDSYCEIENVLYSADCGEFRWYDTKVRMWKELKGLLGLPSFPSDASVRLADYGRNMAVLWDEYWPRGPTTEFRDVKKICCAEIALERRKNCEIWGKVEWFDHVLTVPMSLCFVKVLAPTL